MWTQTQAALQFAVFIYSKSLSIQHEGRKIRRTYSKQHGTSGGEGRLRSDRRRRNNKRLRSNQRRHLRGMKGTQEIRYTHQVIKEIQDSRGTSHRWAGEPENRTSTLQNIPLTV